MLSDLELELRVGTIAAGQTQQIDPLRSATSVSPAGDGDFCRDICG
jgi:hypothetical protein